jgi:hypothetical protein
MTPTQSAKWSPRRAPWANIPPKANHKQPICFSPHLYKARNLVVRFFFNKIKHFRRIATRYDKLAENYLAALKLVERWSQFLIPFREIHCNLKRHLGRSNIDLLKKAVP